MLNATSTAVLNIRPLEAATTHYPLLLQLRHQPSFQEWRTGHFLIAIEGRSRNPVPLHFVNQRSAFQTKSGGCARPTSDYPASCVKGSQNQGAF